MLQSLNKKRKGIISSEEIFLTSKTKLSISEPTTQGFNPRLNKVGALLLVLENHAR